MFTKLLVVLILTGICINLVVAGFFWIHRSAAGRPLQKNILQYLNYIIDDLGTPPNLARAKQIGEMASLQIHYEGNDARWSTTDNLARIEKAHWREWSLDPVIRLGSYRGHHFVELVHPNGRFIVGLDKQFDLDPARKRLVIILLTLLTLILTGAFLSIRWILKPVRWLNDGVREVSRGNLEYRIPLKRSDELRDLAAAFNDMTARVRDMLHTKEQLLLDVSHELRSPLTRVKVALEFLPDGQAKQSITGDVAEMEKMINEILETARMHHLHGMLSVERVILTDLIKELSADFENQPPGVQTVNIPTEIAIKVDPEQVKTVFKNVLTNAIKFSNQNSEPVQIRARRRPPNVVVQIIDNGSGIPPDDLPFIFEPFYRVDKSRTKDTGGYGLGLSLCKTIMQAHGGSIEIDSTLNVGTTVTLVFPA
ncbi:Two-component system sensor histidine kinase [Olavius algarvensis Delta 1 endosymbiont]|nr:Two-component system sensor histidine kinase [Olavius algarvensis Delta 1 endosymbiont]